MKRGLPNNWRAEKIAADWIKAAHVTTLSPVSPPVQYTTFMSYFVLQNEYTRLFQHNMIARMNLLVELETGYTPTYNDVISQLNASRLTVASDSNTEFLPDHPLSRLGGSNLRGDNFSYNEIGRAVHDYYGHWRYSHWIESKVQDPFSFVGECWAFIAQAKVTTERAWPALFSEIIGQRAVLETTGTFPAQKACTLSSNYLRGFDPHAF